MNIETFKTIFENKQLRKKLDQIILDFFGLDTSIPLKKKSNNKKRSILEFIVLFNNQKVLKIEVIDTLNILASGKKIYLNLSNKKIPKYFLFIQPNYIELYYFYCYKHLKKKPELLWLISIFACKKKRKMKKIWKKMKSFNKQERKEILKRMETKNSLFYKDK